jgi:hypothetical protein
MVWPVTPPEGTAEAKPEASLPPFSESNSAVYQCRKDLAVLLAYSAMVNEERALKAV